MDVRMILNEHHDHLLDLRSQSIYVTRHEKTGKYTRSYKTEYLLTVQSASCIRFCRNDCISG